MPLVCFFTMKSKHVKPFHFKGLRGSQTVCQRVSPVGGQKLRGTWRRFWSSLVCVQWYFSSHCCCTDQPLFIWVKPVSVSLCKWDFWVIFSSFFSSVAALYLHLCKEGIRREDRGHPGPTEKTLQVRFPHKSCDFVKCTSALVPQSVVNDRSCSDVHL